MRLHAKKPLSVLLCFAVVMAGCAQYKRPPLMIKVPDFYEHKVKTNQLTLVADHYFESEKSKHFFNSDLTSKGFLPVHFIAFNFGDTVYDLSRVKFSLRRDDGVELTPMDPQIVAKRVLKHTSLRMLGWGFAGLIILSIPFSLVAGMDSFRANQDIRKSVKENTLRVFEIGAKEAVDGFYFFEIGHGPREIREAKERQYSLVIKGLKEKDSENVYDFRIGLN